jgi:hypothetical protein
MNKALFFCVLAENEDRNGSFDNVSQVEHLYVVSKKDLLVVRTLMLIHGLTFVLEDVRGGVLVPNEVGISYLTDENQTVDIVVSNMAYEYAAGLACEVEVELHVNVLGWLGNRVGGSINVILV